jgi:hypothetical protein
VAGKLPRPFVRRTVGVTILSNNCYRIEVTAFCMKADVGADNAPTETEREAQGVQRLERLHPADRGHVC